MSEMCKKSGKKVVRVLSLYYFCNLTQHGEDSNPFIELTVTFTF